MACAHEPRVTTPCAIIIARRDNLQSTLLFACDENRLQIKFAGRATRQNESCRDSVIHSLA